MENERKRKETIERVLENYRGIGDFDCRPGNYYDKLGYCAYRSVEFDSLH